VIAALEERSELILAFSLYASAVAQKGKFGIKTVRDLDRSLEILKKLAASINVADEIEIVEGTISAWRDEDLALSPEQSAGKENPNEILGFF